MLGNQYGIDLGKVYAEGEVIKGAKLKNQLLQQTLQQKSEENRLIKKSIFTNSDNENTIDRSTFINNSKKKLLDISHNISLQRLKQQNPNLSDKEIAELAKKDTQKFDKSLDKFYSAPEYTQKQYADIVNQVGRQLHYISTLPSPEQQESAYQKFKSMLPVKEQRNVPDHYDPQWVELEMLRSAGALKLYEDSLKYKQQNNLANQKLRNSLLLEKAKSDISNKNAVNKIGLLKSLSDYKTKNAITLAQTKSKYTQKSTNTRDTGFKKSVMLHYSQAIKKALDDNYDIGDKDKLKIASNAEQYVKKGFNLNTAIKKAIDDYRLSKDNGKLLRKDGKLYIFKNGKLEPYAGD